MGACYWVVCKVKFKDGHVAEEAREIMKATYQSDIATGIGFCIDRYPFKEPASIEDFLSLYFARHQGNYSCERYMYKNGKVYFKANAAFDARYGWHMVMYRFFKALAPKLENGSYLKIDDDDDVTYRIVNGKIV